MLRELTDLRQDVSGAAASLARERYRRAAGLPALQTLREILAAHKLAVSPESLQQAREALAQAEDEDPKRPGRIARLATLRDFLARLRQIALEPGAAQELFDLPQRPLVRPPGDAGLHGALPPVAVERELPFLRSRERRAEMEAALAAALAPSGGARSAWWEAAVAARSEAGLPLPADATPWANAVLDGTQAIAADLGVWLLERHTGVRAREAQRHDVLHLQFAPRCASAFIAGEMQRTVRRWTAMLGLDLSEVKVDDDDRPLKWPGAYAEPIDPPFEAGLTYLPAEGPRALSALLSALGTALVSVGPPADAPPEDLWLGDPAVRHACAAILGGLVREPAWVRRCVQVELPRDDERAIAIAAVFDARLNAARTLAALQAHEAGPGSRAESAARDLFARATGAELPSGLAALELDPWFDDLAQLRGRALAARARAFLRDRYDEDWWRNPRSAAALQGLWGRGGRATSAELWAEMGGDPTVQPLIVELLEACR